MPILKILSKKLHKFNKEDLGNMIRVVELEEPQVSGNHLKTALAITEYFNVKCKAKDITEYENLHTIEHQKDVIYGDIY